jgi:hypothetical protein
MADRDQDDGLFQVAELGNSRFVAMGIRTRRKKCLHPN